jgi:hypothetical protein
MVRSETRRAQDQALQSLHLSWKRAALVLIGTVAYLLGFAPLYGASRAGVATLAALPVVAAGFLLGLRAGLIVGLLSLPVNALLMHLAGQSVRDALSVEHRPGPLMVARERAEAKFRTALQNVLTNSAAYSDDLDTPMMEQFQRFTPP